MIITHKVPREVEEVTSIICDYCKKDIINLELQEAININFVGGYASIFGDGARVEVDLCQDCLKKLLGPYLRITKSPY